MSSVTNRVFCPYGSMCLYGIDCEAGRLVPKSASLPDRIGGNLLLLIYRIMSPNPIAPSLGMLEIIKRIWPCFCPKSDLLERIKRRLERR